ncbi:Dyp-type peroxidase [Microbacterium sp. H37-C3]|uniref:Dyp-type peroxidase n=1 Tax=Microbacterium sp. H37-C3 TaxID=3004354 RepID=UPI0022AEF5EC|nr:Dyp-type peroxidase [Microbacterium sp. H37-C3]MCZ4067264.1 Dyp-type peroxidase [Microbacterium sp. H37-C3]
MNNVETGPTQAPGAPLTANAVFLVVTIAPGGVDIVRDVLADLSDSMKAITFRFPEAALTCTVGVGSRVWASLMQSAPPAQLRPFTPVVGARHTAPATPGDLLFHIRAERTDVCFFFEKRLLSDLGAAVHVVDETVGFRSFDRRDLLGFVDGTANPVGPAIDATVLVADEDPVHTGGTYVVTQKYVHAMAEWDSLPVETQERILGRTKVDGIELDDAASGQQSHKSLATIEDEHGVEHDIVRDNMPFGRPGAGEFGTYFLGYSRNLWVIQQMIERMFIGHPPGMHDRLLDFSTALTGTVFFAPSAAELDALGSG